MSLLKDLTIENFRGFDKVELKNFSKINLILGRNNSGKTSILEAVFLLTGMSNPSLPDNINRFRGIRTVNADNLKYLFYNTSYANNPTFQCILADLSERKLALSPIFKGASDKERGEVNPIISSTTSSMSEISGIDLSFETKKRQSARAQFKASLNYTEQGIKQTLNNKYIETINATFISSDSNDASVLTGYSELVKKKKESIVLNALQTVDSKIESIQALPEGIFLGLKDVEELVISNMAGDGIRRFLRIITAIANPTRKIIIIDEIENGLHYSAYKQLWMCILSLIEKADSQLFITSHNIETLKCLEQILNETEYLHFQDFVKVYTVANTKKSGFKTYQYSFEGFKDAIENEMEIRG